jgi:hypothetical protein
MTRGQHQGSGTPGRRRRGRPGSGTHQTRKDRAPGAFGGTARTGRSGRLPEPLRSPAQAHRTGLVFPCACGDTGDRPPRTGACQGTPDTAVSPDPPQNRQGTATSGRLPAAGISGPAADVGEFFERLSGLNPRWQLTASQRRRLSPAVAAALTAGRTPRTLAEAAGANMDGVRNPYAVLAARLSPAELPAPPARAVRPPWCGQCDERTRMLDFDGDSPAPCPRCKGRRENPGPAGRPADPPERRPPRSRQPRCVTT